MRAVPAFKTGPARCQPTGACRPAYDARAPHKSAHLLKLAFLILTCLFLPVNAAAQLKQPRRVLIINELGLWSSRAVAVDREILMALENSPHQIEFNTENIDASAFPDNASKREFLDWLRAKYRQRKPELIVVVGPTPIKLMAELHEVFAPNVPIVFWASIAEFAEPPRLDTDFTGVWGVPQPQKTLEAALHLQPNLKHVIVVGGAAPYDRYLEALVKERFRNYESKIEFTYLTELAMPDLLERLKHLPNDTIVFHTSILQDAMGTRFVDATQSVPMVVGAANAPVFVVDDVDVGKGTVGGDVVSFSQAGQIAAAMVLRILNGEKPRDIPIVRGSNVLLFDWRAMRRWGLKESDLPPGSIVLEREPTFWQVYKRYVIAGILVLLAQTLAIAALLLQRAKRRRTEAELVRYSERLRLAMESGKCVGWERDLATGQDSWFGDLRAMFGISSGTFTGEVGDFFRYVHADDRKLVEEAVANARQNHTLYTAEFRIVREDGTIRWVVSRGTFEYGNTGEARRMLGVAVDITEHRQTREALRGSQKRLEGIIESAMDAIIAVDQELRIMVFNGAAEKMFGWRAQDAIGSSLDLFIPERFRNTHSKHLRQFAATGATKREMGTLGVLRGLRANGEEFPIEVSISQLQNGSDRVFTAIIRDITERERAEEMRRTLAAIVESSEDAIVSMTQDGIITSWNQGAERLYGYTEAEALGRSIAMVAPPELREQENEILRKLASGQSVEHFETIRVTKVGKRIDASISVSPIRDATGKLVGAAKIARDITEWKRTEASLLSRLEYESLVSDLSSTFTSLIEKDINANVEKSLHRIGEFLKMDRIRLFNISAEGREVETLFSWQRSGAGTTPARAVTSAKDMILMWWRSRLIRCEAVLVSDLNDLPEEALVEKEYFRQEGIVSAASIPLKAAGEVSGAISFATFHHRVSWTEDLVSQLRTIGEIFWNALKRKRAIEALQESEERFRRVADTAPVLIWMAGADKGYSHFNSPWLQFTGRSIKDELRDGWLKGVHPEDVQGCCETYEKAFGRREPFEMEYRLRRYDGEYRWMFSQGVPRFNPDGSFAGYIGSCVDITDHKLAQEALSEMSGKLIEAHEQERTWVARELHDDISQQIALLMVNLERLKEDPPGSARAIRQHLEGILEQVANLGSDTQALSHRLHSSKLEYLGISSAAASFCRELSDKHGVQIDLRTENIPNKLSQEVSLCLFRILQEALQNAIKHSGSRSFAVRFTGASNEIELSVRDSGVGFNAEEAMKEHGLGLISMRERLKLVRGRLSIDSQPGVGTTVRARVPLSPDPRSAVA